MLSNPISNRARTKTRETSSTITSSSSSYQQNPAISLNISDDEFNKNGNGMNWQINTTELSPMVERMDGNTTTTPFSGKILNNKNRLFISVPLKRIPPPPNYPPPPNHRVPQFLGLIPPPPPPLPTAPSHRYKGGRSRGRFQRPSFIQLHEPLSKPKDVQMAFNESPHRIIPHQYCPSYSHSHYTEHIDNRVVINCPIPLLSSEPSEHTRDQCDDGIDVSKQINQEILFTNNLEQFRQGLMATRFSEPSHVQSGYSSCPNSYPHSCPNSARNDYSSSADTTQRSSVVNSVISLNDSPSISDPWSPKGTIEDSVPEDPENRFWRRGISDLSNSFQTSSLDIWSMSVINPEFFLHDDLSSSSNFQDQLPSTQLPLTQLPSTQLPLTQHPNFLPSGDSSVSTTPICPSTVPYPPTSSLEYLWDFNDISNVPHSATTIINPSFTANQSSPNSSHFKSFISLSDKSPYSLVNNVHEQSSTNSVPLENLPRHNHLKQSDFLSQITTQAPFGQSSSIRRKSEPIDPECLICRDDALPALDPSVFLRPGLPQSAPARSLAGSVWGEGVMVPPLLSGKDQQQISNQFEFLFDLHDDSLTSRVASPTMKDGNEIDENLTVQSRLGLGRVAMALFGLTSTWQQDTLEATEQSGQREGS